MMSTKGRRTLLLNSECVGLIVIGNTEAENMRRLHFAIVALLSCSACQAQPTLPNQSMAAPTEPQKARAGPLPVWVTTLIKQQAAHSGTVIEESIYQGRRTFLVMPSNRAPDNGNEHVLHSEDGRIICEFGGLAGHVTIGSCDMDGINFVQTLYPNTGLGS